MESTSVQPDEHKIRLIVESMGDSLKLPKRFRMCVDALTADLKAFPDLGGFRELRASASGQYARQELRSMKAAIGEHPIVLVDLRQENHGFVNGMAVNWHGLHNGANKGLSPDEVLLKESELLSGLRQQASITFDTLKGKSVDIGGPVQGEKEIQSEEELAAAEHLLYMRFFVTDHHRPSDSEVNRFIAWVKELPNGVWLHFHCRGGVGRASTFFTMYDMMRNAGKVTFKDLTERQRLIGGRDFKRMDPEDTYKYEQALERLKFIEQFYVYCKANMDEDYQRSWSAWKVLQENENLTSSSE
ncbi:fused DSP-PTPase phosphatase/NAD kinase-like protein [Paenibacillus whitsoniae]|uniref:Protein tyrosine phosphatase n=1 Tax=Paenibacillus whitsoniae TaxID=2496558 RepID=A0A430JIH6_9BACL|nr:protein tyrosine phosphatase [Paenibacillus whitsoniae]RTE10776.1 protein tyrosine phosphatase [Paenibacillus whitsoniae]